MSRENVEIVRRIHDAYTQGDFETALSLLDPEIEWFPQPNAPDAAYRGHEGVRESLTQWVGTWEGYRFEVDEIIDVGDQVLVRARQRGRGKGSGLEIEATQFNVWTLRDGKAVRMRMFGHEEEALEAVGLRS
jgi:ketosteroid isomerase-like protein